MLHKIAVTADSLPRHLVHQLQRNKYLLAHHHLVNQDELPQVNLINLLTMLDLRQLLRRPRLQQLEFIRID